MKPSATWTTVIQLTLDTFRQARASGIFWMMLIITGVCVVLCLSVQITGDVAEAQVEGFNQFVQGRRPQRQPVSFHATLDRTSGAWRIASIR